MARQPRSVTLDELIRDGKRLWAYCRECQHNRFLDPRDIPLPGSYPVPKVGKRMKCSACGSRNIHSKPEWFMGNDWHRGDSRCLMLSQHPDNGTTKHRATVRFWLLADVCCPRPTRPL